MTVEELAPSLQRSRKVASIEQGHGACEGCGFRKDQIQNMYVSVRAQEIAQAKQNGVCVLIAQMMQETVDQDEIKCAAPKWIPCYICHDKGSMVTSPSRAQIAKVEIEAYVGRMPKLGAVGAWPTPDVEDALGARHVIRPEQRGQLLSSMSGLKKTIGQSALEGPMDQVHVAQRTVNLPNCEDSGKSARSAARKSSDKGSEKRGFSLMTTTLTPRSLKL